MKRIIWIIIAIIVVLIVSFIVPFRTEQEQEWVNYGEYIEAGGYLPIISYYNIYGIKIKEKNLSKEFKEKYLTKKNLNGKKGKWNEEKNILTGLLIPVKKNIEEYGYYRESIDYKINKYYNFINIPIYEDKLLLSAKIIIILLIIIFLYLLINIFRKKSK